MSERKKISFPKGYIKIMKDKKKNKIRKTPINIDLIERSFNDAERIL